MLNSAGKKPMAGARGTCAPAACARLLSDVGASHLVRLEDCPEIRQTLSKVMPGWGVTVDTGGAAEDIPCTTIRRERGERYSFTSWWSDTPLTRLGIAGATCGAVADLTHAYLDAQPGFFGLHCGAVQIGNHLVAFTGTYRTGKSTLVARLSAEPGITLFCDDILPIDANGRAIALGVQPRLRLPLPDGLRLEFRAKIEQAMTVCDHRYGFLSVPNQAPLGKSEPLAALVLLHRQDGARARFHELGPSEAARILIRQNIADPGEAEAHYDSIEGLVNGVVALTLVYSDLEEAVALLRKTLGSSRMPDLPNPLAPSVEISDPASDAEPAHPKTPFTRSGSVATRRIGSDLFLWNIETRDFFSLNQIGAAVWAILETPQSGAAISATLQEVFHETPGHVIESDVLRLLGQMECRGLVEQ